MILALYIWILCALFSCSVLFHLDCKTRVTLRDLFVMLAFAAFGPAGAIVSAVALCIEAGDTVVWRRK